MTPTSDRIMFEIYREKSGERTYRVVYFTELNDHNKEKEIGDAMNGEHLFDGFITATKSHEAKAVITQMLAKLNRGEPVDREQLKRALAPFDASSV